MLRHDRDYALPNKGHDTAGYPGMAPSSVDHQHRGYTALAPNRFTVAGARGPICPLKKCSPPLNLDGFSAQLASSPRETVLQTRINGYRLQVRRVSGDVRLFTRRGPYPAIAVTATLLRARSFTLDGEDLRTLPLGDRKKRRARLLGARRLGIVLSDHTDEDGATIFRQACRMGLEGIVSKKLSAPTSQAPRAIGSRSRAPAAPPWSGRGTAVQRTLAESVMSVIAIAAAQNRNCLGCGNQQKRPRSTRTSQF
jgi:hypothetical protein